MVTMSGTWDRTVAVLSERRRELTPIVLAFFAVPAVLPAVATALAGSSMSVTIATSLVVILLALVGQLAATAIGSNSGLGASEASRLALARLPLTIGLFLLAYVALLVVLVPVGLALGLSGMAMGGFRSGAAPGVPSIGWLGVLAFLVGMLVFIFLFVRAFFLLAAVIVNERVGVRSFVRSWELTGGLFWRLLGAIILFFIVFLVASMAAQGVIGLIFRLALGPDHPVAVKLIIAVVGAVITSIYYTVLSVFAAQVYVARTHLGVAEDFA